jgi:hypothetical protein
MPSLLSSKYERIIARRIEQLRKATASSIIYEKVLAYGPIRYYTMSVIIGFVALAYGSVPLYKMVSIILRIAFCCIT